MKEIKYLLMCFLVIIFSYACEKEETGLKIKEIKVSNSNVKVNEEVMIECVVSRTSGASYHWEIPHAKKWFYENDRLFRDDGFYQHQSIVIKPWISGRCYIEVIAFSTEFSTYGSCGTGNYKIYYDNSGEKHCFDEDLRGVEWDIKTTSINVTDK